MGLSEVYGGETEEKPKEREAVSQVCGKRLGGGESVGVLFKTCVSIAQYAWGAGKYLALRCEKMD